MAIKISIIETGKIRVRPSQMSQPPGNVLLRRLKFLTDRDFTEPIPIFAFVISHPEGNFLFDLGETPQCIQPGYYPWWQIGHRCVSMDIRPDQGLGSQLRAQGIDPDCDIKAAIISHLHSDHAGGLPDVYEKTDIFVSQSHWDAFQKPFYATMEGANPQAWPENFAPSILKPDGPAIGPWAYSYPITKDQKILAVDTPGHVPGHISLIIIDEDVTYFLTGDAAYNLDLLDKEMTDGINTDPYIAIESQKKIKEFCRTRPVVVLPSHDYGSITRLETKKVYQVG
ncbi:beta-lactamase-like protein [Truncatella angustata]|uniref:Beta-lactamase-like protein n=1 Tax=Truncatella angustata TaxID=152316 RepID=A0A9P8UVN3_9PEZI|nr:beta-lactamase-like protein [Truncatella angustata]KAH6659062.1 beta-lactamase-like protein [Truncatella angustata]